MYESPRIRRLRSDLAAMERLKAESSVLHFRAHGKPAQRYVVEFRGKSLAREKGKVGLRDRHEVEIKLGASYPRTIPEIRWLTPIYHPNISEIGMVCLGGYGTHWVPSLQLDELCVMLWDMARFHNYDIRSPYNREAAHWVSNQATFPFPVDRRPLRDLRAALGRVDPPASARPASAPGVPASPSTLFPPSLLQLDEEPEADGVRFESICVLDLEVDLRPREANGLRPVAVPAAGAAPAPAPAAAPEQAPAEPSEEVIFID